MKNSISVKIKIIFIVLSLFISIKPTQDRFFSYAYANSSVNASSFFTTLSDIPLMKGLEERPELSFSFDKAQGRITQSFAHLKSASKKQVEDYYIETLPRLGWNVISLKPPAFVRGQEQLRLHYEEENSQIFLKVVIEPYH